MDDMINALTTGIGPELGRAIRFTYYEQKRRALKHEITSNWDNQETALLCDLIALAVFHNSVVVPLLGSLNFLEFSSNYGVSKIRIGDYTVGLDHNKSAKDTVRQFFGILSEYGIDTGLLGVGNIETFLQQVRSIIHQWRNQ